MSSRTSVHVFKRNETLARAAAELIVGTAAEAISRRGRYMLALSGGGTPEPVYGLLAGSVYRDRTDWSAAHIFWGDERCVPPDDPGSNYGQAKRLLLDHIGVPADQIWRIRGELTPDQAAADYRAQLAGIAANGSEWPVLDLALMGIGSDGHTASLFPGSPSPGEDRVAAVPVTANYGGRPAQRVSLTPAILKDARNVLFLVTGANKAEAVAAVLDDKANLDRWPAARIRPTSGYLHYYLDEPAAKRLSDPTP